MRVVDIAIFPVKSARGVSVAAAEVEPRGLKDDRRWMLVDARGRFVSQRELPALARLGAVPIAVGLRLSFEGAVLEVERPPPHAPRLPVSVWDSDLSLPEAPAAGEWLSRAFSEPLRLVHQPDDARRPTDDWAEPGNQVSLADGYPLLIATTASLKAVRAEAGKDLGMDRFRPNLVIDGADPWMEDSWAKLRIGSVLIDLVKPCGRCTITTVDQETGRFAGEEPLASLRRIRMSADRRLPGVLFGWNAVPRRLGTIRRGDPVEIMESRPHWPIRARPGAAQTARNAAPA